MVATVQSLCKTVLRRQNAMHESLFETFAASKSKSFHLAPGNQRVIAKDIINGAVSLKSKTHDVSVSNIIVRTDNQELTLKAIEVSNYLANLRRSIFV